MLETILKQREAKYGPFKENVHHIITFKKAFSSREDKEVENVLGFLISLKCARLKCIWEREYQDSPLSALREEDSYRDLLGYAQLIRTYFNAYKMGFELLLTEDARTQAIKDFTNKALKGYADE